MTDVTILKVDETFDLLESLLDESSKVYFSRWGDGEFHFMGGKAITTQEQGYSKNLQFDLLASFCIQDRFYLRAITGVFQIEPHFKDGVIGGMFREPLIERFVKTIDLKTNTYASPIVFNYAAAYNQERLTGFLDKYVRSKRTLFVGARPKESMQRIFGPIEHYVAIPPKNAYESITDWFPEVLKVINDVEVVVLCAGVSASVIQGILWKVGADVHCIDFGSFVDAVDNMGTRAYIRKHGDSIRALFKE